MEKFKEIAPIYYITKFDNYELQEYTEINLEKNKIFNFNKITYDDSFSENNELNFSISIIKTLRTWLEKSSEKYIIISTDDIDYEYIDYFHFDWNYFRHSSSTSQKLRSSHGLITGYWFLILCLSANRTRFSRSI